MTKGHTSGDDDKENSMPNNSSLPFQQGEEEEKKGGIEEFKGRKQSSQQKTFECEICALKFNNKRAKQKHAKTQEHALSLAKEEALALAKAYE